MCVDYQLRELGSVSVKVCIIESSSSIIPARNQINWNLFSHLIARIIGRLLIAQVDFHSFRLFDWFYAGMIFQERPKLCSYICFFFNVHQIAIEPWFYFINWFQIGFCPQFDALLEYLTVQEHLELYATIKGVPDYKIDEVLNSL